MADPPPLPQPTVTPAAAAYWDAASEGRLLLWREPGSKKARHGPMPYGVETFEATGRGRIDAFTIVDAHPDPRLHAQTPYPIALIKLDEGPRMLARIIGPSALKIETGAPVRCVYEARGGGYNVPVFVLARD